VTTECGDFVRILSPVELFVERTLREDGMSLTEIESVLEPPLADQLIVRETHARLNHLWAMDGMKALSSLYGTPHGRTQTMGMDHGEVDRVIAGIRGFITGLPDDWLGSWMRAGDAYDERAIEALGNGATISAATFGLIAAMCHHVGEMMIYGLGPIPRREVASARCVECYARVADHFDPPAVRVDVPFRGRTLPGYLRVPHGTARPACVIVTGGANSVKEENHAISDYLLKRGLATFAFDGPGQGEYFLHTGDPLRAASFDAAVAAVIDVLEDADAVDASRIAIFGKATSGLLVMHSAASEKRLRAIVAHPGSYDWAPYFELQFPFYPSQLELFSVLGANSIAEGTELIKQELTLRGVLEEVRAPILVVNALDDRAIPASEVELIKQHAVADVEAILFPGRAHGGPPALAHSLEADWLAKQLA
jgi:dienelactone hydrolase